MSVIEFNQLLENNSDYLRPFALNLTRDTEVAKDLYQETMYRALANRDKYHYGTNIKAWMYTIMRNIFINDYRKKVRHNTIISSEVEFISENASAVNNLAEMQLEVKDIRTAIRGLPSIFRQPFEMYFEGYRYNEISVILEEPLGTVKSRIHFARKILKRQLSRFN